MSKHEIQVRDAPSADPAPILPPSELQLANRKALEAALDYMDPLAIMRALQETGWTVEEEVRLLVNQAQEAEKPGDRLKAIRQLREMVRDAMDATGLLTTIHQRIREDSDGSVEITRVATVVSRNQRALMEGFSNGTAHLPGIYFPPEEGLLKKSKSPGGSGCPEGPGADEPSDIIDVEATTTFVDGGGGLDAAAGECDGYAPEGPAGSLDDGNPRASAAGVVA